MILNGINRTAYCFPCQVKSSLLPDAQVQWGTVAMKILFEAVSQVYRPMNAHNISHS